MLKYVYDMIHLKDRPLGLGNPYAPNAPAFWAGAGAALIGGGLSFLGNIAGGAAQHGFTKEQQKLQSKLNREEMNHSMNLQQQYQNMVWSQGSAKEVAGMKNAGINPAGFNGPTAMSATPQTGGVGPQGPNMSHIGSDAVNAALSAAQLQANVENTQQNTKLQEQQTRTEAANARIREMESDPRIVNLRLSGEVLKTYAEADQAKATIIEIGTRCQKLCADIGLTEAETKQVQAATAKTFTEIDALVQDIKESKQRVVLMRAQALTEQAKQSDLYASAGHHRASAAEARSAVVRNHADARLKGQEIKNKDLEAKAQEISNLMLDYERQVQAASGDPSDVGDRKWAKDVISLINPLSYLGLNLSTSTSTVTRYGR